MTTQTLRYRWKASIFQIHKFTDNSGLDDSEAYTANAECRLASYQKNSEPAATFTYDHTGEWTVTQNRLPHDHRSRR